MFSFQTHFFRQLAGPAALLPAVCGALAVGGCAPREKHEAPPAPAVESESLSRLAWPTGRDLLEDDPDIFQPAASGRPESALFGSVRTRHVGKWLVASFHEGIDIAPMRRDARGRALDSVQAVADGRVAYINRVAGNSSYGIYVVLAHDSSAGEIFTLYAHLARPAPELETGAPVRAGDVLGIMGLTSSLDLAGARDHLHFEICLMANAHYDRWHREQKLKTDHGLYNGNNLTGIDPLAVFQAQRDDPKFTFAAHIAAIPPAFELVFAAPRRLDFFRRHPALWSGDAYAGRAMVLAVSESGLPVRGSNADEAGLAELGKHKWLVRRVDPETLGRNGRRLIVRRDGRWTLSTNGERWLAILVYAPAW